MAAMNQMVTQMSSVSLQMTNMQSTMNSLKEDVNKRQDKCEVQVEKHEKQLKAIFKNDTRRNLVIFGWEEIAKGTNKQIREHVYNLLTEKLRIPGVRPYDVEFVRTAGQKKNVVVTTLYSAELVRQAVMNSSKLKGTSIYLSFDSSPEERAQKKRLLQHKKTLSEKGKICKIKYNTLVVDSCSYTLDQLDSGISDSNCSPKKSKDKKSGNRKKTSGKGKRQLSMFPEETEKKKKTKQDSQALNEEVTFSTDSDEFEDMEDVQDTSSAKNEELPPKGEGQI